jgi:hypothetical protein
MSTARKKNSPVAYRARKTNPFLQELLPAMLRTDGSPALPIAISTLLFLVGIHELWLFGAVPLWDADMAGVGYYSLASDFTRAGQWLLWSPWTSAGAPLFVMPDTGSFSPYMQILSFLFGPGIDGYRLYWSFTWLLGGTGMLVLARHLGANNLIAIALAQGFMFSGFVTGHAEHMSFNVSNSLNVWAILFLDRLLLKPSLARACAAGLILGLILNGSYPGIGFSICMLFVAWTIVRGVDLHFGVPKRRGWWAPLGGYLLLVAVLSLTIACPPYVGFLYETVDYTVRSGFLDKASVLESNPLTLAAALTLFTPYLSTLRLFGSEAFAPTDVSSISMYFGILPLLLLLVSVRAESKDRFRNLLVLGAIVFFFLACSTQLPLRSWLYDFFPPSRYFRHSSIFRMETVFLMLCATAVGSSAALKYLKQVRNRTDWTMVAVAGAFLALTALGYTTAFRGMPGPIPMATEAILLNLVLLAGTFSLLWLSRAKKQFEKYFVALVLSICAIDAVGTVYLTKVHMWSLSPERMEYWQGLSDGQKPSLDLKQSSGTNRWMGQWRNDGLLIKSPELNSYCPLKNPYHEKMTQTPELARIALGEDRIWFSKHAIPIPSTPETHDAYVDQVMKDGNFPLYIHPQNSDRSESSAQSAKSNLLEKIPFQLVAYHPNQMVLDIDSAEAGWVLVSDRWSRSWTATVNAQPTKVERANFIWRAVEVVAGRNRIEFAYDTRWLNPYLIVSWFGILLGLVGCCIPWIRNTGLSKLRG